MRVGMEIDSFYAQMWPDFCHYGKKFDKYGFVVFYMKVRGGRDLSILYVRTRRYVRCRGKED